MMRASSGSNLAHLTLRHHLEHSPLGRRIAVVIPVFRAAKSIATVINAIPDYVADIIVVDDACPEGSGKAAAETHDPRIHVLFRDENGGVGAATKTGFLKAIELGAEIVVKLDGDGQMDPHDIVSLIQPLLHGEAAFAKGNRFWHEKEIVDMPALRRIGNVGLSFMVKAASGHWQMFDPTNGYFAVRSDVLAVLQHERLSPRYFFEISLLIELGRWGFRVVDVPLPARYADEKSSLSISHSLMSFPARLLAGTFRRIWYRHFWFDMTPVAFFLMIGALLLLGGTSVGVWHWWHSIKSGVPATAGTVMLAGMPVLLGLFCWFQALVLDVSGPFTARVGVRRWSTPSKSE